MGRPDARTTRPAEEALERFSALRETRDRGAPGSGARMNTARLIRSSPVSAFLESPIDSPGEPSLSSREAGYEFVLTKPRKPFSPGARTSVDDSTSAEASEDNGGGTSVSYSTAASGPEPVEPIEPVRVPTLVDVKQTFELIQRWEGVVERVDAQEFEAELSDLTDPTLANEAATFSLRQVSDEDLPLVAPGAAFYWCIGYAVSEGGQRSCTSIIRFRRLPRWTRRDIKSLQQQGSALGRKIRDLGRADQA